jgi:hypothetical protein
MPNRLTKGTAQVGNLALGTTKLTASGADLNTIAGQSAAARRTSKTVAVALAGGTDTGGGLGSWQNPEGAAIIIEDVVVDVTVVASAACNIDVGTTNTNATTLSDNLIDGADIHSATGQFDNFSNKGSNGKSTGKLASGKWITASMADAGASAGFVGTLYISYFLA